MEMSRPLLISDGTVVTMDGGQRALWAGHVLVLDGKIAAVSETPVDAPDGAERIEAAGMVVMPGLVDTHAHAGHTLTKGLGSDSEQWMNVTGRIYAQAVDTEFWAAEAALSACERIKCGTTTAALLFGGGPDIMRTDDAAFADAHLSTVADMGLREVLAVGPNRPDSPWLYRKHDAKSYTEFEISLDAQLSVCAELIEQWQGRSDRLHIALSLPVFTDRELDNARVFDISRQVRDLARRSGVLLVQDGHRDGSIAANADRLDLFDDRSLLAHCIDLTQDDIAALKRTGAKVAHNPSALMSVSGR